MGAELRLGLDESLNTLARAWRILDSLGLVDQIFNHISSAMKGPAEDLVMVMNPYGYLPDQVDSQNLRVCRLREYSSYEAAALGVNPDGLRLHSLLHTLRMREGVVVHTHSLHCVAVGCSNHGLLPLTQTAMEFIGDLEIIEFEGVFRSHGLTSQLRELAERGGVALLRNHGALVVADTVCEAVYLAYYVEEACKVQVATLSQGVPFKMPGADAVANAHRELRHDRPSAAKNFFDALSRRQASEGRRTT